jgi:GDP-D-mannose dehydratase
MTRRVALITGVTGQDGASPAELLLGTKAHEEFGSQPTIYEK